MKLQGLRKTWDINQEVHRWVPSCYQSHLGNLPPDMDVIAYSPLDDGGLLWETTSKVIENGSFALGRY